MYDAVLIGSDQFAVSGRSKAIRVFDLKSCQQIRELEHAGRVGAIDSYGANLVSSDDQGNLYAWNKKLKSPKSLAKYRWPVSGIRYSDSGKTWVSVAGLQGSIWNASNKKLSSINRPYDMYNGEIEFAKGEKYFFVTIGEHDETILQKISSSGKSKTQIYLQSPTVNNISLDLNGKSVLVSGYYGLKRVNVHTEKVVTLRKEDFRHFQVSRKNSAWLYQLEKKVILEKRPNGEKSVILTHSDLKMVKLSKDENYLFISYEIENSYHNIEVLRINK